jgi:hypothetical protein
MQYWPKYTDYAYFDPSQQYQYIKKLLLSNFNSIHHEMINEKAQLSIRYARV